MITDEMVNRADSVLSRVSGGIPDETIRLALQAALSAQVQDVAALLREALEAIVSGGNKPELSIHDQQRNRYSKWAVDIARAALSAQVQDVTGWQPIETAPRDGTQFLALLSNGWYELLRSPKIGAGDYCWWSGLGRLSIPIVETHPKNMDWEKSRTILATHWMPLPAAPAKQD